MFGFIGLIFGFIKSGLEAVLEASIAALQWAVGALWAVTTTIGNSLISLGSRVLEGFQKAWDFLKVTYEDVLKPAWAKFWTLFDRVQTWLKTTFAPILKFLNTVRNDVLSFYRNWVRPVLDIIDATRGVLRVLEALHIAWAKALDDALGNVEGWVNEAFNKILGPLNQIIGLVNRVVTADGLFQKVAHIRTLQRDIVEAARVFNNSRMRALSDFEVARMGRFAHGQSLDELNRDLKAHDAGEQNDAGDAFDVIVADYVDGWDSFSAAA